MEIAAEIKERAKERVVDCTQMLGEGGEYVVQAIVAAYCAGLAAARKERPTAPAKPEEKPED